MTKSATAKPGHSRRKPTVFESMKIGLEEALAVARGEAEPARLYVPPEIDVKRIRRALDLSQDDFATRFGFSINQIKDWEQGRSRPLGGVRAYLLLIERKPGEVMELLRQVSRVA
jgi:putative transcriptional regulator